jgi:hypothetical protein
LCKNFASIDSRKLNEIQAVLESHDWVSTSSDKTPVGLISRFTCTRCGDEYVAMLTSTRALESGEVPRGELEVTAEDVVLFS